MVEESNEDEVYSVADLNRLVKNLLEAEIPPVWVRGEVSNCRIQSSGHAYFSLKDAQSQIAAVLFRGNAAQLRLDLRDGMELLVLGEVSVYEPRGTYQIIVRHALESGEGKLQQEFERLKKRLDAEGLFAPERKKTIPRIPAHIAVLTSAQGAAWQDFQQILKRRGYRGRITLWPVPVQGASAAGQIVQALREVDQSGDFDLLVLTRGGGSLEDLWPFNEEATVRAVAECGVPIISAVGHEIDFTLTDFAADWRAETPSGAAEAISSHFLDWGQALATVWERMETGLRHRLEREREGLRRRQAVLQSHSPGQRLENAALRLDELMQRLQEQVNERFHRVRQELADRRRMLMAFDPQWRLERARDHLAQQRRQLERILREAIPVRRDRLQSLGRRLRSLGVEETLQRGFVLVRDADGKVITEQTPLNPGDPLELQFRDGHRSAEVR